MRARTDLDLTPLAKAIDAVLPDGYEFVLLVMPKLPPSAVLAGAVKHGQFVTAMPKQAAYRRVADFVDHAKKNFLFNPTGK